MPVFDGGSHPALGKGGERGPEGRGYFGLSSANLDAVLPIAHVLLYDTRRALRRVLPTDAFHEITVWIYVPPPISLFLLNIIFRVPIILSERGEGIYFTHP